VPLRVNTVRTFGWRSRTRNGPVPLALNEAVFSMPFLTVHGLGGLVFLAPLLAHDHGERDHVGQDREGTIGLDFDGEVAHLAHGLDVAQRGAHVGAVALGARKAEDHVVGGERRAVMEHHALAQLETPDVRRGLLPAGGQERRKAQVLVAPHEGFIDVGGHAQLQRLVERVRIERQRVALVRDPDGLRARDQADGAQGAHGGGRGHFFLETHGNTPRVEIEHITMPRWRLLSLAACCG
jgi:hypothetical protein